MIISAPDDRAVQVQVYEPRQTPEQDEVILEEFLLAAGEEREVNIMSATAAYRTVPQGIETRPENWGERPPDQEPLQGRLPGTEDELAAGEEAASAAKANENKPQVKGAEPSRETEETDPDELQETEEQELDEERTPEQKATDRRLKEERQVAKDTQKENDKMAKMDAKVAEKAAKGSGKGSLKGQEIVKDAAKRGPGRPAGKK